jgi:hypothetical protein
MLSIFKTPSQIAYFLFEIIASNGMYKRAVVGVQTDTEVKKHAVGVLWRVVTDILSVSDRVRDQVTD